MVDGHAPALQRWDVLVSCCQTSSPMHIVLTLSIRYVAMHAMQEENSTGHEHHPSGNGYAESGGSSHRKQGKLQMRDTFVTVVGFLLPLLTRFGHHHH